MSLMPKLMLKLMRDLEKHKGALSRDFIPRAGYRRSPVWSGWILF